MSGWTERRISGLFLSLIALLAGCAPDDERALLDEYLTRVARVTEMSVTLPPATPRPAYPPQRALTLEIPERGIDVAEFFELHGCDMGDLVGLRNSPLGRLQGPSQRLGYETAWLEAVARCGQEVEPWMTELAAEKERWLPALFWNATFAGGEMRTALGAGARPATGDLADVLRGLQDTLDTLGGGGEFEVAALEQQLGRLRQGSWLGPARDDWALWRRHLQAAAALLDQSRNGLCLSNAPTPRSRRLENVFMKFYVNQIQPELARGMQSHSAWIRELERLNERLAVVAPPPYSEWFETVISGPHSEWQRTRDVVVAHAQAWQRLFAHCGIEPVPGLGQD